MTKRKKLKGKHPFTLKKKKKDALLTSEISETEVRSTTECIAYKMPAAGLMELLEHQEGVGDDYSLLGVQFEFKKREGYCNAGEEKTFLPCLEVMQLYYKYDEDSGIDFKLYPETPESVDSYDPLLKIDLRQNMFRIDRIETVTMPFEPEFSHHSLAPDHFGEEEAIDKIFKQLDYFPSTLSPEDEEGMSEDDILEYEKNTPIGFVYFTIGQLRHIFENFKFVIISGCQLRLGKKLSRLTDSESKNFDGDFFTLKIEGMGLKPKRTEDSETEQEKMRSLPPDPDDEDEAEGTSMTMGHPCPPVWFTFEPIGEEIWRRHPELSYRQLLETRETWVEKIYDAVASTSNDDLFD